MYHKQARSSSLASSVSTASSETSMSYSPSVATCLTTPDEVFDDPAPQTDGMLPCEFVGLTSCNAVFQLHDVRTWIEHIIGHLEGKLPSKVHCWYCDGQVFDAQGRRHLRANFEDRMQHICNHIRTEHRTAHDIRPDYHMLNHLHHYRLIPEEQYRLARDWKEAPRCDGIMPPNYIPPPKQKQRELANRVVSNQDREERQWRREQRQNSRQTSLRRAN
ncbi:hypothetical protein F4775DRAFT_358528 [Biscogniauxia sp. FL1348]|nr:hypothetical protein F4775DRAFT_358528 [Biscogniauxia sp. FL1348]